MQKKVIKALDAIRPALQADGGDLRFVRIDDNNVVYIDLLAACNGCPMATITLKQGIERVVKMQVPEIAAVELDQSDEEG